MHWDVRLPPAIRRGTWQGETARTLVCVTSLVRSSSPKNCQIRKEGTRHIRGEETCLGVVARAILEWGWSAAALECECRAVAGWWGCARG
eukprot:5528448-Prymnesium_polylepis.1